MSMVLLVGFMHYLLKKILNKVQVINTEDILNRVTEVKSPFTVGFLNAHAANLYIKDEEFQYSLDSTDLLLRDGVGTAIGLRKISKLPGINNNGTDLIPEMVKRFNNNKIVVLGSTDNILTDFLDHVSKEYNVNNFKALNGFDYNFSDYLSFVKNNKPDLIILAMGMPKQELLGKYFKDNLEFPTIIVFGGAVVSFMSGHEVRAPSVIRKVGLEWFWRLVNDPKRLFKRYVLGNFVFLYNVFISR
jgi:exopolysaccharide biosynthesis WecB/TagA/CpsF family protein